jgi:hypothetical protein
MKSSHCAEHLDFINPVNTGKIYIPCVYFHISRYGKTQPKSFFQMSMFMCFIDLCHVQNIILCKGHHSISNIL